MFNHILISINPTIVSKAKEGYSYRFSSLKDDGFVAGLGRNQDTGSQGFPAAVDGGLGIDGAADNYELAIVGVCIGVGGVIVEERAEAGDGEVRGVAELAEGGGGGGEFEEGANGGVG